MKEQNEYLQDPISVNRDGTFYTIQNLLDEKEGYCPFSRLLKGEKIKLTLHRISQHWMDLAFFSDKYTVDYDRAVKEVTEYTKIGQSIIDLERYSINSWIKQAISGKLIIFKRGKYDRETEVSEYYELLSDYVLSQQEDGYFLTFVTESKVEKIRKDKDQRYFLIELDHIEEVLPRLYYTVSISKALYGTYTNSPCYDGITDEQVDNLLPYLSINFFESEKLEHVYRCREYPEDGV